MTASSHSHPNPHPSLTRLDTHLRRVKEVPGELQAQPHVHHSVCPARGHTDYLAAALLQHERIPPALLAPCAAVLKLAMRQPCPGQQQLLTVTTSSISARDRVTYFARHPWGAGNPLPIHLHASNCKLAGWMNSP
jgi:hypothetical protein